MARVTKKLPNFSIVSPGSTSVLNLPIGLTYDFIKIKYQGCTLADLLNFRWKIDGNDKRFYKTATDLNVLNKYRGMDADFESTKTVGADKNVPYGVVTLWFIDPTKTGLANQRQTAFGTGKDSNGNPTVKSSTIEFDINGAVNGTHLALEAYATQSDPMPVGLISKVKRFPFSSAVAGSFEIDSIPTQSARIERIHLFKDGDDISKVELDIDSGIYFQADKEITQQMQKDQGRTPQAKYVHMDWVLEGDPAQAVATQGVQDFRLKLELDTAGSVDVIVEYLDAVPGI